MEKIFQGNGLENKSWGSSIYIRQRYFKARAMKSDKEGYLITLKGSIHHKLKNCYHIWTQHRSTEIYKENLEDFKKDIDSNKHTREFEYPTVNKG